MLLQGEELLLEGKHEEAAQAAAQREEARCRQQLALRNADSAQSELAGLTEAARGHKVALDDLNLDLQHHDDLVRVCPTGMRLL